MHLSDRARLPYLQAVLLETARLASVLPIAPPRRTTGPIQVQMVDLTPVLLDVVTLVVVDNYLQVGEHLLPAGSLVQVPYREVSSHPPQVHLYSLHHNLHHWGDPHTFRPERFLTDGRLVQVCRRFTALWSGELMPPPQDPWLVPFSIGRGRWWEGA